MFFSPKECVLILKVVIFTTLFWETEIEAQLPYVQSAKTN